MKSSTKIVFSPLFKRLLFVIAGLNGAVGLKRIIESFQAPDLYRKDFVSGYLMARAILNGINPYTPLPKLTEKWISGSEFVHLNHPTPHPPMLGFFCLPFGFFEYETSALLWLFFESGCILASICLIFRWWGTQLKPGIVLATFSFALGWGPVIQELWSGQLGACLLVLSVCAWFALRNEKNVSGGALLGGMIALKLAAWPVVFFLALRRKWSGVLAAATVVITTNLVAIVVLGLSVVKDYYFKVGPAVSSLYRVRDDNFSTWTIGKRLFDFDEFGHNFVTTPLWESPALAHTLTYLVPSGFLIFSLALTLKAKQFDTSFGILAIVGILINPIAWDHYLILAVIPIIIAMRRIGVMEVRRRIAYAIFVICVFMSIPPRVRSAIALLFSSQTTSNGIPIVPFWAGAITLTP